MKNVYFKLQIKNMSYMLIEQFQKVFHETTVKHNSLQKIIQINFKLVVGEYERECVHSRKKHVALV